MAGVLDEVAPAHVATTDEESRAMSTQNPETPGPPEGPPSAPDPKDERMWATLCHLSALVGYVGVPFGHIIGPLVVWLIKREQLPFLDDQGKEALNFQISVTIYGLVCVPLVFLIIGIPLLIAVALFQLIFTIIAGVKASTGVAFRYPLCIRFIR
jgi:hypothetical protein